MPRNRRDDRKTGRAVLTRAAQGAALAAIIMCANTAAVRAGGDDPDSESLYTQFMRTLGLKDPRTMEYGINYSERSPLVVPPNRDLPPPQAATPPPIPDWPKDPDIRKREAAKAKKNRDTQPVDWEADARPLSPADLNKGRGPNANTGGAGGGPEQDQRYGNSSNKQSLFSFDWFKKEDYATFTGEPARASLTDPPPGYQTPSPDQPYGIGPDKKPKVASPADHGLLTR
jgi:hypothetical protein